MAIGENSPCFRFIHQTLGEDLVGVEVGIWDGGNAEAVLGYIKPRLYFMIDPYRVWSGTSKSQEEFDQVFIDMFNKFRYYSNVVIMREPSHMAANNVPNNLDFVYIDGAHEYDAKMIDFNTWYPKIRQGGILCGDDYNRPEVQKAVKDFADEKGLNFMVSDQSDPHPPEFIMIKGDLCQRN
jgi:hypothetical protein